MLSSIFFSEFSFMAVFKFVYILFSLNMIAADSEHILHIPGTARELRVIGGYEVYDGFAPYQVSIQNIFGDHICGGSIINSQWVLTAAHCMEWPKEYLKIAAGSVNWTAPLVEYAVEDVKIHCLHNQPMYHNDVALIKLNMTIVFDEKIQPIQLASSNILSEGDNMILTGWGSTKLWGKTPDVLHGVDLKYVSYGSCKDAVRNPSWIGSGHICSSTKNGEGSCHGDSGGPLVDESKVQVGIVNWGDPCAVGSPDVYADVAYYYDWIRSITCGTNPTC